MLEAWGVRAAVPVEGAGGAGPASAEGKRYSASSDRAAKRLCDPLSFVEGWSGGNERLGRQVDVFVAPL